MNEQSIMAQTGARLTALVGELTVRNAELETRYQAAMAENAGHVEKIKNLTEQLEAAKRTA